MSIKSTIPKYTDLSPFPFGKYKNYAFQDIPVEYFHWLWHNTKPIQADMIAVHKYIKENIDALKLENDDLIWSK